MTDLYAVVGNPIKHSQSPLIHHVFATQTSEDIQYSAKEIGLDTFSHSIDTLRQSLRGINITVPFKEQAWQYATDKSDRALRAGAVNTLRFDKGGRSFGDNTDGVGLCRDLNNHHVTLTNTRILLLGAGGAAKGVLEPLLNEQPSQLFIANRTASKAITLAEQFSDLGNIHGGGYLDITGQYDLIINATAASLQGKVPPLPEDVLSPESCCYDMMYSSEDTAFIAWAKAHQASVTIDGIGMLVEQAAESFYIWRGVRPDTKAVIDLLQTQLK